MKIAQKGIIPQIQYLWGLASQYLLNIFCIPP